MSVKRDWTELISGCGDNKTDPLTEWIELWKYGTSYKGAHTHTHKKLEPPLFIITPHLHTQQDSTIFSSVKSISQLPLWRPLSAASNESGKFLEKLLMYEWGWRGGYTCSADNDRHWGQTGGEKLQLASFIFSVRFSVEILLLGGYNNTLQPFSNFLQTWYLSLWQFWNSVVTYF